MQWSDVSQNQRDYQSNIEATDRHCFPSSHPSVEWPPPSSHVEADAPTVHVAYTRGSNIVVKVKFSNANAFALSGTLTWQAARLEVPKQGHESGVDYVALTVPGSGVSISLPASTGSQEVTLTLTGVPNYVAVGQLQLKYDLPLTDGESWGNNGTQGSYAGWERICLVDATPVGLQAVHGATSWSTRVDGRTATRGQRTCGRN